MEENPKPLRIVLATNHLQAFTGSELMIATLAHALQSFGHTVLLYAPFVSDALFSHRPFLELQWTDSLAELKNFDPQVGYTQHHTIAITVRQALPYCPLLHGILGVLPFLEQPPLHDLALARMLVLSEEVLRHVERVGPMRGEWTIFRNVIDDALFNAETEPAHEPKSVVLHSYKLTPPTINRIYDACATSGLTVIDRRPGVPGKTKYEEVPSIVREGDIVIASGRSAIEGMCAGRAVIVMADCGEDGLITPNNFDILSHSNFSGRATAQKFTVDGLVAQFKKYDPNSVIEVSNRARQLFGLSNRRKEIQHLFVAASETTPKRLDMDRDRDFLASTISTILGFKPSVPSQADTFSGIENLVEVGQAAWLAGDTKKALACFWAAFNNNRVDAMALDGLVSLLLCFLAAANDSKPHERKKALEALLALNPQNGWATEQLSDLD